MSRPGVLRSLCLLSLLAAMVYGCGAPDHERMVDVDPVLWKTGEQAVIAVDNADTVGWRRLELLWVFNDCPQGGPLDFSITVVAPDSTRLTETLRGVAFADVQKQNSLFQSNLIYRDSVRLDRVGTYTFTVAPSCDIAGVKAVGINVTDI